MKIDAGEKSILIVAFLFSLPIILSGVQYQDDIMRSATGEGYWWALGRPLSDVVLMILGFGSGFVINMYPLTNILATTCLSCSAIIIYRRFSHKKRVIDGLCFSLLCLSPFYLQNLSYQFDSLPMFMGVLLATLPFSNWLENINKYASFSLSVILLIACLSLYQASVNVFISLTAFELIFGVCNLKHAKYIFTKALWRAITLASSLIIYMKTIAAYFVVSAVNSSSVFSSDDYLNSISANVRSYFGIVNTLLTKPVMLAWSLMFVLFIFGVILSVIRVCNCKQDMPNKVFLIAMFFAGIFTCIFAAIGPFIFVDKTIVAPRVIMGLSGLMLMIAYLSSFYLRSKLLYVSIGLPVALSLSISAAYGNSIKTQRDMEDLVMYDIATSIPISWKGGDIYVSGAFGFSKTAKLEVKRYPSIGRMIMPLFDWSASEMLKHYDISAGINRKLNLESNECKTLKDSLHYTLYEGCGNVVKLK